MLLTHDALACKIEGQGRDGADIGAGRHAGLTTEKNVRQGEKNP